MTEEEKKAIKLLKKAKEPYYTEVVGSEWIKGYTTILGTEVDNAIDTVLNLVDKQETEINKLNNVIDNAIYIIKINNKNFENFTDENLKLWLYGFDKCAIKEEDK